MVKRFFLLVMVALATIPAFSADDNTIVAEDITVLAGDKEVLLTVNMNNTAEISDLQFDMSLPNGVTIALDEDDFEMIEISTSRTTARKHSVDFLAQGDGSMRIMCSSSRGDVFSGNSGAVINVYLNIAEDMQGGNYEIKLKNIVLSNADSTYYADPTTSNLKVKTKHKVTFVADGETIAEDDVMEDDPITAPAVPDKVGHSGSWADLPEIMPDEDIVVTALYVIKQYTLKFVADDTVISEKSVDYGSAITAPNAPAKTGYTFVSWGDVATTMPGNDVTYTAQYSINQYTVTFKVDGEIFQTITQDYGTAITTPEAPTKEGYTFSGWNNVASTVPAQDVTYEASFIINQYAVTFKVDGEVFKTFTQDYGTVITTPESPTKEGYTFSGWQDVASTVPAQDVTYEANFIVNQYTLKFIADGQVVSEASVDYSSTITAPQAPAKTGYTFVSWGEVAATMPAKNVTYTAQYKVNKYKLTYLIDGNVYKTYSLDYDSVITPEGNPEDDDYFYAWEDIPERMPDHDVTVNAYVTGIAAAGKGIANGEYEVYSLDGKKLNNLQKGVNIIRYPNGTTKKVVVK